MNKYVAIILTFLAGFVVGVNVSILTQSNYLAEWGHVYICVLLVLFFLMLVKD